MHPSHRNLLLLDGATGTELGRRGADISLPLWSARALGRLCVRTVTGAISQDLERLPQTP